LTTLDDRFHDPAGSGEFLRNQNIIRGNHGVMDLASLRRFCGLCKTNLIGA
jgi:hypothetical protein